MNEKLEKSILSKNQKGYELVTFCLNWVVRGDDRIGGLVDGSNLS